MKKVKLLNYCKHGDLETTPNIAYYSKNRNICLMCSNEIIYNDINYKINKFDYIDIIEKLKNSKLKIAKEKLALWYPKLYKTINSIKAKYWNEQIYLFLHNLVEIPKCTCNNYLTFNNKLRKYKINCEHCNRSKAVTKQLTDKSIIKWTNIFINNFKIENPQFKILDKYYIQIIINNKTIIISKRNILRLKNIGILDIENQDLPEYLINESILKYKTNPKKYYINQSLRGLKIKYPVIWKSLQLIKQQNYPHIKSFNEFKFLILNDLKEPPKCTMCNNYAVYNNTNQCYSTNCEKHKYTVFSSKIEQDITNYVQSFYNNEIKRNYKIYGDELDIYLPDLNIGIEYNGLYWHSNKFKNKDYHYNKWKKFKDNNIDILFIWEDDWKNKKDILKSILLNRLGYIEQINETYIIKEINQNISREFLNINHVQGYTLSKINLGLFYNNKLVSIMTFNNNKLLRYCDKLNYSIKDSDVNLFNYYLKKYYKDNSEIISYCNIELISHDMYIKLGFIFDKHIKSNYYWTKGNKKYTIYNFKKYKLYKQGFNKIIGVGSTKWSYKK